MRGKNITIELGYDELEVLKDALLDGIATLRKDLQDVELGTLSVGECGEFDNEYDAEFYLSILQKVENKVTNLQDGLGRNNVRFIQQESMFRIEERVKIYQVRNTGLDALAFVHETRHGVHFLYSDLEALIKSYTEGKESKLYFGCEKEAEFYLLYWKGESPK